MLKTHRHYENDLSSHQSLQEWAQDSPRSDMNILGYHGLTQILLLVLAREEDLHGETSKLRLAKGHGKTKTFGKLSSAGLSPSGRKP